MKQSILIALLLTSLAMLLGNCKNEITEEYLVSKTLTETFRPSFLLSGDAEGIYDVPASAFTQLFDKLEESVKLDRIDLQFVSYSIQKNAANTAPSAQIMLSINDKPLFSNLLLDLNTTQETFVSSQLNPEGVALLRSTVLTALEGTNQSDIRFRLQSGAPDGGVLNAAATFYLRLSLTYSSCEELPTGMGDRVCID